MSVYLTAAQIREALGRFEYRDSRFGAPEVFEHPYEGTCVCIKFVAQDAYERREIQDQTVNVPVPPLVSVQHLFDWLVWRYGTIAMHEVCEYAWVDGKPLYNPHSGEYWELR